MSKRDGISKDENFCFFRRNFGEISCFGGRRNEKGGRNVDGRNIRKFRQKSEKFQPFFEKIASSWKISEKNRFVSVYFGDFSAKKTEIFLPVQPAHRIQNLIMIRRQSLCFSAWLKNRGFRVREI